MAVRMRVRKGDENLSFIVPPLPFETPPWRGLLRVRALLDIPPVPLGDLMLRSRPRFFLGGVSKHKAACFWHTGLSDQASSQILLTCISSAGWIWKPFTFLLLAVKIERQ